MISDQDIANTRTMCTGFSCQAIGHIQRERSAPAPSKQAGFSPSSRQYAQPPVEPMRSVGDTQYNSGMADDAAELLSQALKLPPAARAALAEFLIESLDVDVDEDSERVWRDEIAIRVRGLDSGTVRTVPWNEARRRIRDRFRS